MTPLLLAASQMDLLHFTYASAAVFLAIVSQMLTGFGFAMVLIPLLMLASAPPAQAVVVTALLSTILTSIQTIRDRDHIDTAMAGSLLLWSLMGLPLGVLVLKLLPAEVLQWVVISVVAAALLVVAGGVVIQRNRVSSAVTGLVSGVLLTSTGINGPPIVALVRSLPGTVRNYRATIAAIFCAQGWLGICLFVLAGQFSRETLLLATSGLVALPLGITVGERLFRYVNPERLRWGIMGMLTLCLVFLIGR